MTITHNIVSVSGGKDSTALLLLALERGAENLQAVFADTGHEHAQTYEYVQYLNDKVFPIRTIRADFTVDLARKAAYVAAKWKPDLMADRPGVPGWWEYIGPDDLECTSPSQPSDPYLPQQSTIWRWWPAKPPIPGLTSEQADEKIERAVAMLKPTGNPFLDLCIWKGRFPSTKARFCSEELKRNPIIEQVQMPILELGEDVVSWQGVRADESPSRAKLPERDLVGGGSTGGSLWNYRPILQWTVDEVFAMHRKHGVDPNPLYKAGMGRVGCMPCIHARKEELREIAQRYPEEIERVAEWERMVSEASKRGCSTFFEADTIPGNSREMAEIRHDTHGIWQAVEWSKTTRGGRFPCHLFMAALEWPVPPEAVLRADKPTPPRTCPPCTGDCHQGRTCPVASAAMGRHIRDANIPSVSERTFWWTVAGIAAAYALLMAAAALGGAP